MNNINTIYCDFDGTITKQDAVNTFLDKFAPPEWVKSENLWIAGKISSMENAKRQVKLLPPLSTKAIDDYINSIKIDDYFVEFTKFLKKKNIKLVILSDGFDLFIKKTLEKYNLTNIEFFANKVIHNDGCKISLEFPYHNPDCEKKAGMCKCIRIKEKEFAYIGDGTSDLCVAQKASMLFATKSLKKYCEENLINHYPFNDFRDIISVLDKF